MTTMHCRPLNALSGDQAWKHKIIVLPPGSKIDPQKPRQHDPPVLRRSAEAAQALGALLSPAAPSWQHDENAPHHQDAQIAQVITKVIQARFKGWSPPEETAPASAFQPFLHGAAQGEWLEDTDLKAAMPAAYCGGSEVTPPDSCVVPGCTSTVPAMHVCRTWTPQQLEAFKAELEEAVSAPCQVKMLVLPPGDRVAGASGPLLPQPVPEDGGAPPQPQQPRPWQYPVVWNLPPQDTSTSTSMSTEANDIA
jgi:hypothetical protein